jgi:hypothetical protein
MALTRARLSQVNTEVASLQDPITLINRGASIANVDVGFVFNRNAGTNSNIAVVWNESGNTFAIGYTASTGADNSNVNITSHANLTVGNIFGNIGGGTSTANVYITGALLPTANVTYDLGSSTRRFKTLWLANNTIDLGGESLSVDQDGTWSFTSQGARIQMGKNNDFDAPVINSTSGTFTTLTTTGTTKLGATTSNVVVAATTQTTGATSGALVVKGGVGIEKDLWVAGNLTIAGTTTTVNSTTTDIADLNLTLAKNAPTAFAADGAGITIDGAAATILYNSSADALDFNKLIRGAGNYFTTANITTANIVTVDATTGNITTLNVQTATAAVLNATTANITNLRASGNIVAASGTESVSTVTGAAVVVGGIGISGNVTAGKVYTGSGLFWAANGISALSAAGTTASASPPGSAKYGDLWYNTANDVIYQYLSDGTSNYWIDISSQTIAANTQNTINGNLTITGKYQVNSKQAVNGPAFSAYADNTLQTITSGSQQKVLFQVEEFDTDGCYTSSRFTPNVEGYYQLNAEVRLDGSSGTGEIMIVLYKNTGEYKRGTNQQGTSIATNFFAQQVSTLVYANGTTDYFEIRVQQTSGSSLTVTAVNNPAITWFNGCMVRGA